MKPVLSRLIVYQSNRIVLTSTYYKNVKNLFSVRALLLISFLTCSCTVALGQVGAPADSLKADSIRIKKGQEARRVDNFNQQYDVGDY